MGSAGGEESMRFGSSAPLCPETTIEIKIKTLDSQTYTMRVEKCVPVPALKEQIASVTGILSEQQRLICRGKVLKDDTLLSAYHVEDGHTLHLVVRQPNLPSSEGLPDHPASDTMSSAEHGQGTSVLVGTFNISEHGDGALPDLGRIVSAVLSSFGVTDVANGGEGANMQAPALERLSRVGSIGGLRSFSRQQGDHIAPAGGDFSSPLSFSANSLQPPVVIPDSLTTLSQYLSRMRQELNANGGGQNNPSQATSSYGSDDQNSSGASGSAPSNGGLPTPASLAEMLQSTRQFLNEQAGESLLQLARQLEDHTSVSNPVDRMGIQSNALRVGTLLQNMGALLLELGRATMTLRIGQTPAEAVVNAGPAVFISTSGPNPIMVQPLPFQPGASFGTVPTGTAHTGSGLSGGSIGAGFLPRNIDIRIRTGSVPLSGSVPRESTVGQPVGQSNPTTSGTENMVNQATSGANESSSTIRQSGVRVVPLRAVVAGGPATSGRAPSSRGSLGLLYPVLGRVRRAHSGNVNSNRGQTSDEPPQGADTFQQSTPDAATHQANVPGADEIREFDQFFRTMLATEQIQDDSFNFMGTAPVNGNVGAPHASNSQAEASGVGDDATFLSNLLRQIMPIVSQSTSETNNSSAEENVEDRNTQIPSVNEDEDSSDREISRRRKGSSSPESSKRQKRE